MIQEETGSTQGRSFEEEDVGLSPHIEVLHSSWEH
jgi:hypothetical protein